MRKVLYFSLLLLVACDTGTPIDNLPPETKLFLESINLSGNNRLSTVVKLHWSGEDQDGYVKGFELSFDEMNWNFITQTDSTFRFDIPAGSDTTDIDFYVRAIDNDDDADPSPAYLSVPIRNSQPIAKFDTLNLIPDTVFSTWSIIWTVDDLDGFTTLDSIFVRINDGAWKALDRNTNFVSFVPQNPGMDGIQNCDLYATSSGNLVEGPMDGLVVGGDNRLYMQVRDISGSLSPIDSTKSFFIRRQTADLLVIDAQGATSAEDVYFPILANVYPTYDYIDFKTSLPPYWDPTFGFLLNLYDKIFWYSDGNQLSGLGERLAMEVGATQIQNYLNNGGKIFFTSKFPNPFPNADIPNQSAVFSFSPMDSLSTSSGQARIPLDSLAVPQNEFAMNFPTLQCGSFITGADPFYAKDPSNDLYHAQITRVGGWSGTSTIAGRTVFTNGRTNQVFFSVELHKLNKDLAALEQCFDLILNQEFNW